MGDPKAHRFGKPVSKTGGVRRAARRRAELTTLAEIGRAILRAQLDQDELCELIHTLAGRIVPTDSFQLGLFENDSYHIKVWFKDGERQEPATFTVVEGQGIVGWLRTSHQSLLVRDFELEMAALPARPTYISASPPRSALFLPMLAGDATIGAISIQSPEPGAFDEDQLRLLTILANQAASALNNARLYAHSARRLNDLTAVSEVGRRLTSILDLDLLLEQVVELIRSRFGFYHVQIFLVAHGSDRAIFKASSGHQLNEKWLREGRSLRIGQEGIISWVAQHAEPLLANDVQAEPRYRPDDPRLLPDTRAELAVPLLIDGEVIGVLDAQTTEKSAFGPDELFVMRTLADQVAVAINSARAYEAQREEAWTTTVTLQVAEAASQATSVDGVLESAVRVIAMLGGVASTLIWLWDDDYAAFHLGAAYGLLELPAEDAPVVADQPDAPGFQAHGAFPEASDASDESVASDKSEDDASLALLLRFFPGDWPVLDQLRVDRSALLLETAASEMVPGSLRALCPGDTLALLPMLSKGEVIGAMGASFSRHGLDRDGTRALGDRRLAMLSALAHQVAAAVDNSRLSAMTEEAAWTSTVLLQVAEAIRRLQPVDATLEQVTRIVPALTGVDRCVALLLDDAGSYRTRTVHARHPGLAEPFIDAVIAPGELPLLDDACRLGQPLVIDDVAESPRVPAAWRERFGSRTLLVVPLLVVDEPIGALLADDVDSSHMFSPRRIRIVTGIANQAAIAIENARLQTQEAERARLGRELELAHGIQRKLLPMDAPHLPGYQIAYRWRSAREVGGDFFDFISLDVDRLGLVVADVSDKGIPAALYMMFARTLIRAAALSGREPASALARTNELMLADSTADMFVTVYYSLLDRANQTLTYASGGHNLAFYVPARGSQPEPLTTGGLALGIVPDVEFEQKTLALLPGDAVVFFTDGVAEIHNAAGEDFGEQTLSAVVCSHREEPAESIADAIEAAVQAFAGDVPQYDDFTFILVKRDA